MVFEPSILFHTCNPGTGKAVAKDQVWSQLGLHGEILFSYHIPPAEMLGIVGQTHNVNTTEIEAERS